MHALLWFNTEILLWNMQRYRSNQRGLLRFIQCQLTCLYINQLQLPGQQLEALLQGVQGLIMQLQGAFGIGDQVLDMP